MKYVNFKKLSIKNFLSVGIEPVVIDFKTGLHVITGVNKDKEDRRNGVGKSTIADAIHFAIFGETLRELKKEFIVNNKSRCKCEVELIFELKDKSDLDTVRIVRKLGSTKCFLYINDEDKTRDSIPNTNKVIHDMLAGTPEIFQNCVIMTVNNTVPFMAKKKVEKRKFIEGIFNLQVFGNMLHSLRLDLNSEKQLYEVDRTKFEEVEKTFETLTAQKSTSLKDRKSRQTKLKSRKEGNTTEISNLHILINQSKLIDEKSIHGKIHTCENNIEKCDTKVSDLNRSVTEIKTGTKYKQKEKDKIDVDRDVCPTCFQKVTADVKAKMEARRDTIDEQINTFSSELKKLNEEVDTFANLKIKLKEAMSQYNSELLENKEIENKKQKIDQLEEWNKEIDADLTNHVDEFTHLNTAINTAEKNIAEVKSTLAQIGKKIKVLETVKFIVSEEGVKSFIVKKILNLFNSKLAYYLNKMDANCQCTFNEYFEEEIINEKGALCSYFNFSGAERKNIDLACLFAFMDIRRMQGDVAYNISVYDELLDSSLDEKGVELVLDILKERVEKYNECIMVISHRKESIKAATGDVIFLEKENGITRKVEYLEYGIN